MKKKLLVVFGVALILRLLLLFSAYHGDLNNNLSWAKHAYENGLNGFYGSNLAEDWPYSAPNQPPLTILVFFGVRAVWQQIENFSWWLNNRFQIFPSPFIWFWEEKGMILLIKFPSVLADLGIGWLIFTYYQKKKNARLGAKLATLWLFNPVSWYNSSLWGQTDSLVNLLGLASVMFLLKKDLKKFLILFTLSILFKGSLAVFVPVLGFIAIGQKHPLRVWIKSLIFSLVTIFVVSIWFHPRIDLLFWLTDLYKDRILPGEIGYLTANAFNFWWIVNPGKVLDSTLYFGLTARLIGIIITLYFIRWVILWLKEKVTDRKVFISLALISLIAFLFMTRIHERYLYPFFPYATFLVGSSLSFNLIYVLLSVTHLINLYNLFWEPTFGYLEFLLKTPTFPLVLTFVNFFAFLYWLRLLKASKL